MWNLKNFWKSKALESSHGDNRHHNGVTIRERYGDDFYGKIGRIGGSRKGIAKGFAVNPRVKEIGRLGGSHTKPSWTPERREAFSQSMKKYWEGRRNA